MIDPRRLIRRVLPTRRPGGLLDRFQTLLRNYNRETEQNTCNITNHISRGFVFMFFELVSKVHNLHLSSEFYCYLCML